MSGQALLGGKYMRQFQKKMIRSLWAARSKKSGSEWSQLYATH